jgi:hypothetical protein
MNMDDFFVMGFCKAAEEHGVDPVKLAEIVASAQEIAQRGADLSALRQTFTSVSDKLKTSPQGTTVDFTPEQVAALEAFRKKHGDVDLSQLM